MRYYFYKMMVDSGGAPCVYRNLLSLAICKPSIRSSARVGDWIFGFGARSTIGEKLIYVAEVTEKLTKGAYYERRKYQRRPDCIYHWKHGQLKWRRGARFHEGGHQPDIGAAPHNRAAVLLSNNFRYLGREGTDDYKARYPVLADVIAGLRQGHRVNHPAKLEQELKRLQKALWRRYPEQIKIGQPNDKDKSRSCATTEGTEVKIDCRKK